MSTDPRLRLLGGTTATANQTIQLLDDTRIRIVAGPDTTAGAAVAVAALAAMTARLFGQVSIEPPLQLPPNWWGATNTDDLLSQLEAVQPHPSSAPSQLLTVGVGNDTGHCDVHIGGGDWNVRLGLEPQPLEAHIRHGLGVHAAACLTVSQLLLRTLQPVGFPGVPVTSPVVMNLIDYSLQPVGADAAEHDNAGLPVILAGLGSVGSSAVALLAGALAPSLAASAASGSAPSPMVLVDPDSFDPGRNPYRYPALAAPTVEPKVSYLAQRLAAHGLAAAPAQDSVASWTQKQPSPGWDGLLISSVDTVSGRLDVADVLARTTLSVGVAGMELHAQREQFGDGLACPFCDFVRAEPPLTQAGLYAQITGLPVTRILTLLDTGAGLETADVDHAVATGHAPAGRREALVGRPLGDLVRQAYAEAELRGPAVGHDTEVVSVAAPQVSWFAGVLVAAEVLKQLTGLPLLDRRVDFDLSGLPAGLVRRVPADATGTCVCRSGIRLEWRERLYGSKASSPHRS